MLIYLQSKGKKVTQAVTPLLSPKPGKEGKPKPPKKFFVKPVKPNKKVTMRKLALQDIKYDEAAIIEAQNKEKDEAVKSKLDEIEDFFAYNMTPDDIDNISIRGANRSSKDDHITSPRHSMKRGISRDNSINSVSSDISDISNMSTTIEFRPRSFKLPAIDEKANTNNNNTTSLPDTNNTTTTNAAAGGSSMKRPSFNLAQILKTRRKSILNINSNNNNDDNFSDISSISEMVVPEVTVIRSRSNSISDSVKSITDRVFTLPRSRANSITSNLSANSRSRANSAVEDERNPETFRAKASSLLDKANNLQGFSPTAINRGFYDAPSDSSESSNNDSSESSNNDIDSDDKFSRNDDDNDSNNDDINITIIPKRNKQTIITPFIKK